MKKLLGTIMVCILVFSASAQNEKPAEADQAGKDESGIVWTSTSHNFSEIPKGKPVKAKFEYTNKTDQPVSISKVVSSCGCTVASYDTEPVLPDHKGELVATFDAAKFGGFKKLVTVYMSNDSQHRLYLKGTVGSKPPKAGR